MEQFPYFFIRKIKTKDEFLIIINKILEFINDKSVLNTFVDFLCGNYSDILKESSIKTKVTQLIKDENLIKKIYFSELKDELLKLKEIMRI